MNKKITLYVIATSILIILGMLIATTTGAKNLPYSMVLDSLINFNPDDINMQLVRDVRLPRAISTFIVGGLLAMAGAMMQGVTRNPVAEPSLMGITQGATFAIALAGASPVLYGVLGTTTFAFVGALISGLLVLGFSLKNARNLNISRLLLAGTALSTFFISLATVVALLTNKTQDLAFWVSGGFRAITWNSVLLLLVVGTACVVIATLLSPKINIVNLGEDVCIGLGGNPTKIRMTTLLLIIPMCAVCVAVAGNIAFVGLIIPYIVRKIFGQDYRVIMPLSFLFGSTLVVWSDILARNLNAPYETPIGLFTSIIGVPLFIYMIRKES